MKILSPLKSNSALHLTTTCLFFCENVGTNRFNSTCIRKVSFPQSPRVDDSKETTVFGSGLFKEPRQFNSFHLELVVIVGAECPSASKPERLLISSCNASLIR
jgi:hypothetical protein